ncbi:MAG: hypothetical protein PHY80_03695 [Rickettsiales bacterium]|nr:hypothetical protein [Rickettsiales bacterium]
MKYISLFLLLFAVSCGRYVTSDKQKMFIDIYPSSKDSHLFVNGAEKNLSADGVYINKASDGGIFKVQKDGYIESSVYVKSNINVLVCTLDAALTLGIGLIIDHNSGRLYYFDNNNIRFNLIKMEEK